MQSVNALNSKYDQIAKPLKDLDEAKDKQILENASLKAEILKRECPLKPSHIANIWHMMKNQNFSYSSQR